MNVWDEDLTAEAYFYAGRVCSELGKSAKALVYYKDASRWVTDNNHELQIYTYY